MKYNILPKFLFPFLFSITLAAISIYALILEALPFANNLSSPKDRFIYLEQKSHNISLSIYAQRLTLNDCLEAIAGPTGLAQPTNRRNNMLENCRYNALNSTKSMPTFALAWYIAAFTSAELKLYDDFNSEIIAAQITAPNERWLAHLRVKLALENYDFLSEKAQISNSKDIRLIANSNKGMNLLASEYVEQTELREIIMNIIETLSEEEQNRFVNNVRSISQQASKQRANVQ